MKLSHDTCVVACAERCGDQKTITIYFDELLTVIAF